MYAATNPANPVTALNNNISNAIVFLPQENLDSDLERNKK